MKLTFLILSLLPIGGISTVLASDYTFNYTECVDYARENNIMLKKSRLSEQSAELNLDEARGQWQPTLDFSTKHSYINAPWGANKNVYNSNYGLNAGWTVWNGGVRENTINKNKIQAERSKIATGELFRSLETDILQAYFNILYAFESIEISKSAVELSKATEERAYQLMTAGKMSRVDYAQLKARYEQDLYNLTNAEGIYNTRCMDLKKLLQMNIEDKLSVVKVEFTPGQVLAALPPIEESYKLACQTDEAIKGLELEKDISEYDIKIAKMGHAPNISLNAGIGTGYNAPGVSFGESLKQTLNEQIGVSLSIPIFDNKKTQTATAKARLSQQEAQLNIDDRMTELSQIVENWYVDTTSAQS